MKCTALTSPTPISKLSSARKTAGGATRRCQISLLGARPSRPFSPNNPKSSAVLAALKRMSNGYRQQHDPVCADRLGRKADRGYAGKRRTDALSFQAQRDAGFVVDRAPAGLSDIARK